MKVVIISDTHGSNKGVWDLKDREQGIDLLVHMGDVEGKEEEIRMILGCPCHIVAGNNDFFSSVDREKEICIGDYKVFLTHGHQYMVSIGTERLRDEAKARGVDIVMFGHTHKPYFDDRDGLIVLNPGSLSYPRQEGRKRSYMVMEIGKDGKASFETRYLD